MDCCRGQRANSGAARQSASGDSACGLPAYRALSVSAKCPSAFASTHVMQDDMARPLPAAIGRAWTAKTLSRSRTRTHHRHLEQRTRSATRGTTPLRGTRPRSASHRPMRQCRQVSSTLVVSAWKRRGSVLQCCGLFPSPCVVRRVSARLVRCARRPCTLSGTFVLCSRACAGLSLGAPAQPLVAGHLSSADDALALDLCAFLTIRTNSAKGSTALVPPLATTLHQLCLDADTTDVPIKNAISEPARAWSGNSIFEQLSTCPVPGSASPKHVPLVRSMSGPLADVWEPFLDGLCVRIPTRESDTIPAVRVDE